MKTNRGEWSKFIDWALDAKIGDKYTDLAPDAARTAIRLDIIGQTGRRTETPIDPRWVRAKRAREIGQQIFLSNKPLTLEERVTAIESRIAALEQWKSDEIYTNKIKGE